MEKRKRKELNLKENVELINKSNEWLDLALTRKWKKIYYKYIVTLQTYTSEKPKKSRKISTP